MNVRWHCCYFIIISLCKWKSCLENWGLALRGEGQGDHFLRTGIGEQMEDKGFLRRGLRGKGELMLVRTLKESRVYQPLGGRGKEGSWQVVGRENQIVPKCLNSSLGSSPPVLVLVLPTSSLLPTACYHVLPTPSPGLGLRWG